MDDPDTPFPGHRDGGLGFRNRIHSGADQGHIQTDSLGQECGYLYIPGKDRGFGRDQKNVIKSQTHINLLG
jgi:hypothetical protein